MLSVTGPIVPSPVTLYSVEYTNNDDDSIYLRPLLSPSPQVAAMECSIAHTYVHIHTDGSFVDLPSRSHPTTVLEDSTPGVQILKYKPVAKKIKPVAVTLPEEFRTTHQIVGDPLAGMPSISLLPPEFSATGHYNEEACDIVDTNHPGNFLLPEECKLMHHFMMLFEKGFAWNEMQKGQFCEDFFPLLKLPVIPHVPWALKNIPILLGIYEEVIKILHDKIALGTYEPSSSSYRSRWFTVLKKNGKLRIVHDLQSLNTVTIHDSALILYTEQLAETFGSRSCYGLLDLFVGYGKCPIHIDSRDFTTFPTPFGAY